MGRLSPTRETLPIVISVKNVAFILGGTPWALPASGGRNLEIMAGG